MQSTMTSRAVARPERPLTSLLTLLLALSSTALLGACRGGPSAAELGRTTATAGTIELETSGRRFVLISEAMLERMGVEGATPEERTLNFYSAERTDASAKVVPNDAIAGLVQFYEEGGFAGWAAPGAYAGAAPAHLTVTVGDSTRSMARPTGAMADPQQLTTFIDFVRGTLEVYNAVQGRQNVDGAVEFKQPELSDRLKRESGVGLGGNQGGNR